MMRSRARWWLLLSAAALVAIACFAIPMYVIRPFRAQGARELQVALAVLRVRPVVSIIAVVIAIASAVVLWRSYRTIGKRLLVLQGAVFAIVFGVLSWVNVYELMFHGAGAPEFMQAKDAKLEPDEMVLAVNVARTARAYPVGYIAYHHIINDRIGNVPIAATY
jgi:hypothetical protein